LLPSTLESIANFKAALNEIVEYVDATGPANPGYQQGTDTFVQNYDLKVDEPFWSPISGLDASNHWTTTLSNNVVGIQGTVDLLQNPCINYPLVPSPSGLVLTVNFISKFTRADSKLALQFDYTYYEDQGPNNNILIAGGAPPAIESTLFNEFNPDGFPTTATAVPGGQTLSIVSTFQDNNNGAASTQPDFTVWFALDTTVRTAFSLQVVTERHF